ncbi:MAG: serine/threonine protein kinase [Burkholderiales bacterium]|nr:serine/threonine protein kinase [Burkholderiales bacterium]
MTTRRPSAARDAAHPFAALTPDAILDAVESTGRPCDGRLLALNSYENRVWRVGLEDGPPVVAKFYRAGRWTDAQIDEEHDFALDLADDEVPVVPPIEAAGGRTRFAHAGFRFALYPLRGGRAPELDRREVLEWTGRFLGRIHLVGAQHSFEVRETLDPDTLGHASVDWLLDHGPIPDDLRDAYAAVADQALDAIDTAFDRADVATLRLHGDCHPGNILWTDAGPHFVDLDDARTGPAVQDLWMLLSGPTAAQATQLAAVLAGYEQFRRFDRAELALVEPLRTLRLMHYAAWLARRWDDPAFPAAFPWFAETRFWQDHILALREQIGAMAEPALDPDR